MKKETMKKVRGFVAPLVQTGAIPLDYVVHPSGLIVPVGCDSGFTADLYGNCPVAVLDEDTFADALHHTAEEHMPKLLLGAFDHRAVTDATLNEPITRLRDFMALILDCVDWSAVEDEWDDDMINALMTESGEVLDYIDTDGFWLVVKPSGNLITALIELNQKAHDKWLARPVRPAKVA